MHVRAYPVRSTRSLRALTAVLSLGLLTPTELCTSPGTGLLSHQHALQALEDLATRRARLGTILCQVRQLRALAGSRAGVCPQPGRPEPCPAGEETPARLLWPVIGPISSRFGPRRCPLTGRPQVHTGLDIAVPAGTPVRAAAPGVVTRAAWARGYGILVEVTHAGGITTRYGHLGTVHVRPGERVRAGHEIARSGSTGRSTGAHLHFEVRVAGVPVYPEPYLGEHRTSGPREGSP